MFFFSMRCVRVKARLMALMGYTVIALSEASALDRLAKPDDVDVLIQHIQQHYVKPISEHTLWESAMKGMLDHLDPHSAYLDEKAFTELNETADGSFGGVGVELTPDQGMVKIVTTLDETPARKAGLRSGDMILRINDKRISDKNFYEIIATMRGETGSFVNLTVFRKGLEKLWTVSLRRETIQATSIKHHLLNLLNPQLGYVRISQFQANSAQEMKNAILALKKAAKGQLRGLILDLRDNPGGLLEAAVDVSDAFIHQDHQDRPKWIVYTKGRLPESNLSISATPGDILQGMPMVVLINEGSASAAEVVAGALQDYRRAVVVGSVSFGKGSVQTVFPLGEKKAIKLTTAMYYTPSGRSIQGTGILPDILVEPLALPESIQGEPTNASMVTRESDLTGYLAASQPIPIHQTTEKSGSDADLNLDKMKYQDHQLYQATNILQGLVANRQKPVN